MPNLPISGLPAVVGDLADTDELAADQGGVTKSFNQTQIRIPSLRTTTTNGSTFILEVYDTGTASYKIFGTGTAGLSPSLALEKPSGGVFTIDGAEIGDTEPANATFNDVEITNGSYFLLNGISFIRSGQADADSFSISAYDVDGSTYLEFVTVTSGNTPNMSIFAQAGTTLNIDNATIGGSSAGDGTFSNLNLEASGNFTLGNGSDIRSSTSLGDAFTIKAYDVDGAAYKTFITVLSDDIPQLVIEAPSGASARIDNVTIGGITPAQGTFNSLYLTNGAGLYSTAIAGQTMNISVYDTDDFVYRNILLGTSGTSPSFQLGGPNITGAIDNSSIGVSNPSTGTFTTLAVNQDVTFPYQGAIVSVDATGTFTGVTNLSAPRTITLLSADALVAGKLRVIYDGVGTAATNNITVDTQGSETINGASSYTINTNYGYVAVVSNGTNWIIQNKVYVEADPKFSVQSTATSANATANFVKVTDNSSARTITLLSADAAIAGTIRIVKDAAGTAGSSNNITIDTQGSELIDGSASQTIIANYGCLRMMSDGSNWWTF